MAELKRFQYLPNGHVPAVTGEAPPAYDKCADPATYSNPAFQGDYASPAENGERADVQAPSDIPVTIQASHDAVQDGQNGEDGEYQPDDAYTRFVTKVQDGVYGFFTDNADALWKAFYLVLLLAYIAYFIGAMTYKFGDEGSIRLLVVTLVVAVYLLFRLIMYVLEKQGYKGIGSSQRMVSLAGFARKIRLDIVLAGLVMIFAIVYIIVEIARHKPSNLISLGGMAAFLLLFYIFSYNPARVQWRPVVWGILLQFIFAVIILRTSWGYDSFAYLGDRISEFLAYTDAGSKFVFGDLYTNHFFAFKVLPVVVFFSTFVSMMYYVGFMQFIIRNVGRFLAFCLGTSPAESLNAAGNIFIGQSEAPLMIRPFLGDMTNSELHAVLTGGFATIAGSVMAAYMQYGVPANHLLSASVMSAPAALAMSKLFYPETEKVKNNAEEVYNMQRGNERNIIEAASNGAVQSVKLVANIAVNLIAFVALLDGINATLTWFGERVGMHDPKLTFQLICSYLFYPLSFLMGVDSQDRLILGELIGTKTFLNEFVAYSDLSVFISNKKKLEQYLYNHSVGMPTHPTGWWNQTDDGIYLHDIDVLLEKGLLSERSVVVATYALCGFSNLASMGLMLGALSGMAPHRRSDISGLVLRAMIAGNVACFMTACIAGLLSD